MDGRVINGPNARVVVIRVYAAVGGERCGAAQFPVDPDDLPLAGKCGWACLVGTTVTPSIATGPARLTRGIRSHRYGDVVSDSILALSRNSVKLIHRRRSFGAKREFLA